MQTSSGLGSVDPSSLRRNGSQTSQSCDKFQLRQGRQGVKEGETVYPGSSQISYVPFQRKVQGYEERTYVERVPVTRTIRTYEERREIHRIPKEVRRTEYLPVEKRIQWRPEVVKETTIETVPRPVTRTRWEYVPVEKQVIHYPESMNQSEQACIRSQSEAILAGQGVRVTANAEFKQLEPTYLYEVSRRQDYGAKPIGYIMDGATRLFSNERTNVESFKNVFAKDSRIDWNRFQEQREQAILEDNRSTNVLGDSGGQEVRESRLETGRMAESQAERYLLRRQ